ncbi:uncharacterized protein [Dermacentor albipictus]|uniref:uncharacterized protein isoform X4 n=1 Tax=Dermacentor albipictus TaxID=60249 RepID=UPI0038FCCE18
MTSLCTMLCQEEGNQKIDAYLNSLGFWRKQIAADGSCLFRVVSEHVHNTQSKHEAVRRACVQHLRENKSTYAKYLDGDFENYLLNMENVKVWGGHLEMHAMATLYKKDFVIFDSTTRSFYHATENSFKHVVMLCYTHGNHYDAVYSKETLDAAAFCQLLTSCEGPVPHQLQGCLYQQTLLPSVQDLPESQCTLTRKGKAKDLSVWLPTVVTGAHPPLDFSLPQPSNVSCSPPDDQMRFPLSPSLPMDTSRSVWTHPVRMLAPGSPCPLPQPLVYQGKERLQSSAVFDFKPQTRIPPNCSQSTTQDVPRENDDSSVVSPGHQTQLPTAHRAETPYSGNFTTSMFDQCILGQPAHTEKGFLSAPLPSSYDYVSAPSFTYAAPYPDVMCSPPPCTTPDARANDTPLPYDQEVAIVQHPQQQQFVPSYFPVPFANSVFSCEPPAPAVNLAAQRSNDPEGRDLPSGTSPLVTPQLAARRFQFAGRRPATILLTKDVPTRRFFYNIGRDYFWTYCATLQPFVFQSTQGYNSNFNMTHVPYVVDSSMVMPDVRCSTSGSAATTNSFTGGDGSPSSS